MLSEHPPSDLYEKLLKADPAAPGYLNLLKDVSAYWAGGLEVEMNMEDGRLKALAESDEACIFVMNHNYQAQDPALMATFIHYLLDEYGKAGKEATFPKPRIILNEDILLSQSKWMQEVYAKFGAIGVDATLYTTAKLQMKNVRRMIPLLKDFNKDKSHIFIFPEGKMTVFNNRTVRQRIQPGIGETIRTAAQHKKRVKVVPLGFAYNQLSTARLGSIHIGEPVYFVSEKDQLLVSTGNVTPENASQAYSQFFWNQDALVQAAPQKSGWLRFFRGQGKPLALKPTLSVPPQPFREIDGQHYKVLRENGKPVGKDRWGKFAAPVLAENMRICIDEAKKVLPDKPLLDLPTPEAKA